MKQIKCVFVILALLLASTPLVGFTGLQRFSDEFYAAQKYFFSEAIKKYPKLVKEKAYPEVPIQGTIEKSELLKIAPLTDILLARRTFIEEVRKYPEQLYPEIFNFLYQHPALLVSPGNKAKFEALQFYFTGFYFLFSNDPYAFFHPEVKGNPCPVVFCYSDDKKNKLALNISNSSKIHLKMALNQGTLGDALTFKGKNPVSLKAGSGQTLQFDVNLNKLKVDSTYSVFQVLLNDPTQPKIKLTLPVVLLPSRALLKLPLQFFDLRYIYNSHVKNIDLYSERTSGPEPCNGKNCSGYLHLTLRNKKRKFEQYAFGELALVQFNVRSSSYTQLSTKNALLEFELNELGELQGKARDCPGPVPGSIGPCPPETANNGVQLYGSRKLELGVFVPEGKSAEFFLQLDIEDLKPSSSPDIKLTWLEGKKLMLLISDSSGKEFYKEIIKSTNHKTNLKNIAPGKYICSIYPVSDDNGKHQQGFEINHLNHGSKAQFFFRLKGKFVLRLL